MSRAHRGFVGAAAALVWLLGAAAPAFSQVFLPPKGEGSVSVIVQQGLIVYHLVPDREVDSGSIRWNTVYVDFTYGLSKKLALNATLPWVRSDYKGSAPHCQVDLNPCPATDVGLDDGAYHATIQDIHTSLLYRLKQRGVVITPFVGAIMPSHNYPYFNHSAAGRRLFEVEVGTGIARFLDPVFPDAYVQARYAFGVQERVLGISNNRSTLAVEAGYLIKRSFQVFANANGQYTHGGIDFDATPRRSNTWEVWSHHDQIGRVHFLQVGVGAAFAVTDRLSVSASVIRAIAGHNGHEIDYLWSVSVSRSVGRAFGIR